MTRIMRMFRVPICAALLIAVAATAFTGPDPSVRRPRLSKDHALTWDSANPAQELAILQSYYAVMNYVSFDVSLNETDKIGPITTSHISTLHFKVNGNKYYMQSDSVDQVQDSIYNVTVYKNLQQLIVGRPNNFYDAILQMNVTDADWQQNNVQNMTVKDSTTMRRLSFQFYQQSVIKSLNIVYDTAGYRLRKVYGMMNTASTIPGDSTGTAPTVWVTLDFSNYQSVPFSDTVFNMNRYFTVQQGNFIFVPPYDTYQFVNSTLD